MRLTAFLLRRYPAKSTIRYSGLPERYIKRTMRQVEWENPDHGPQYVKGRSKEVEHFFFDENRPWTTGFTQKNAVKSDKFIPRTLVEPIKDWSFFKGDIVEVLIGKDKGKQGIVNYIVEERNWVFVEGLNTKRVPIDPSDPNGVEIKQEKPLLITCDVKLVDPSDNKPTEVEWRYKEDGERVRVSSRTGRELPIPVQDQETVNYKRPELYKEQPMDTPADVALENTYEPYLGTFQMQLMEKYGIKEDRIPKKSYWYYTEELPTS